MRGSDHQIYSVMRCLLRWICVTRSHGKQMALPEDPMFGLYRYLHRILDCFSWKDLIDSYTNMKHSVLAALRAFIQLKLPHFISGYCLLEIIHCFEHEQKSLKNVFPQVYEMCKKLINHKEEHIEITYTYHGINGEMVPGHAFLYGVVVHPKVPLHLRKMIFLHVHVMDKHRYPAKCKRPKPKLKVLPSKENSSFFNILHVLEEMSFLPISERSNVSSPTLYPSPNVKDLWVVRWSEFVSETNDALYNCCIEPRFWKNTIYTSGCT